MKIRAENFFVVQGWMITDLHLKGTELILFAVIYGFSQEVQTFSGGLSYLAEWTNSTKQTVITALKGLLQKGLIEKIDKTTEEGVKKFEYRSRILNRAVKNFEQGYSKNLNEGVQNFIPNNIRDNIDNKISNNISRTGEENSISDDLPQSTLEQVAEGERQADSYLQQTRQSDCTAVIENFTQNEQVREALRLYLAVMEEEGKRIKPLRLATMLKDLALMSDEKKIASVKQSTVRVYQGFYEVKDNTLPPEEDSPVPEPTFENIREYCRQRRTGVNAEAFYRKYSRTDWKIDGTPIKDWRELVRAWEKHDGKTEPLENYDTEKTGTTWEQLQAWHEKDSHGFCCSVDQAEDVRSYLKIRYPVMYEQIARNFPNILKYPFSWYQSGDGFKPYDIMTEEWIDQQKDKGEFPYYTDVFAEWQEQLWGVIQLYNKVRKEEREKGVNGNE